ncbi:MAG: FHA domain-containing protein [Archangiaceae bacterium]|nr:FHA domain-containing protein [Archangiaceae bacterium]
MPIGFSYYCRRYLNEPAEQLRKSIDAPVLYWAVPATSHQDEAWAGTAAGAPLKAPLAGEPVIFELKKSPGKPNAFAMGVTVGRIDSNDVVIDDGSVSRFHAYFQKDPRTPDWNLVDAESKNGTWAGPLKLQPNERARVTDGTKVRFGDVELTFLSLDGLFELIRNGLK